MPLVHAFDLQLLGVFSLVRSSAMFRQLRWHQSLVAAIANAAYVLPTRKRRTIEEALQRAFDGRLTAQQVARITKQVYWEFWDEVFSLAYEGSFLPPIERRIAGVEHLDRALARGHGAILWESGRYGKRVIAKHILHANGFPVCQVHARTHLGSMGVGNRGTSRLVERVILPYADACERRVVREILYLDDDLKLSATRQLYRWLEQNAIVCVAVEGRMERKHVLLPFLGKPHPFATGLVSLARLSRAPLLPLYCTATTDGRLAVEIGAPVPLPDDAAGRDGVILGVLTAQVAALEARIRNNPEWYWGWNLLDD